MACKNLKLRAEFSQAGVPRNNSVIERTIGDTLEGSRALLRSAGLPVCFWPFAARCYCLFQNIGTEDADDSPWFMTHKAYFGGLRNPFGCLVRYLQNKTKKNKQPSMTTHSEQDLQQPHNKLTQQTNGHNSCTYGR